MQKQIKNFLTSPVGITLAIGILLSLILPGLLTSFKSGINFSDTGEIGDTIGGIAGPILNITGLIVVYFSFQEQLRANKKQWRAFKSERMKSERQEQFSDMEKAINLLSEDVKKHKPSFIAITQIIIQITSWEDEDADDFLGVRELIKSMGGEWHGNPIKSIDDYWSIFSKFNRLASYLETQFSSIKKDIAESDLTETRRILLLSSLRNQCLLPTYEWLPEDILKSLWDTDEVKFQETKISMVINVLRVDVPMMFPDVIHPYDN